MNSKQMSRCRDMNILLYVNYFIFIICKLFSCTRFELILYAGILHKVLLLKDNNSSPFDDRLT